MRRRHDQRARWRDRASQYPFASLPVARPLGEGAEPEEDPLKPLLAHAGVPPPPPAADRRGPDACALYASVSKKAEPTHEAIEAALVALEKMLHRAGNVDGEGDGCGLLIDIPRKIWAEEIRHGGHASKLALDERFAVGHIFIPRGRRREGRPEAGARAHVQDRPARARRARERGRQSSALGPTAREEEPVFWQVGGLIEDPKLCFEITVALEDELDLHVASFSTHTCVYKVLGAPSALGRYYPDLHDGRAETAAVYGHNRYSTNTWPSFKRVQPFAMLGHNGEINTIARLRQEARMLGVPITKDGSDSQDLNRTVESLVHRDGLSLVEAMELVLPPIVNDIKTLPGELRGFYMYLRQAFGPLAQGPVALVSRHEDECLFSTDALGLRPLWHLETTDEHVFSSEPGVVAVADTVGEPKPLAPGEKILVQIDRKKGESRLRDHQELQRLCAKRWRERTGAEEDAGHEFAGAILTGGPLEGREIPGYTSAGPSEPVKVEDRVLGGFGWQREDMKLVQQMAATGPGADRLAGLRRPAGRRSRRERQNLADYFKESVAVVTNPAIDREREVEHFSCRAVLGRRPGIDQMGEEPRTVETAFPVLLGGHDELAPLSDATYRRIAKEHKTFLLEDIWEAVPRARGRQAARPLEPRVGDHRGRDRAPQAGGHHARSAAAASCWCSPTAPPTRATAATSTPTWRWPRWTWRCASTGSSPARPTCAAAAASCCARPHCATCTT